MKKYVSILWRILFWNTLSVGTFSILYVLAAITHKHKPQVEPAQAENLSTLFSQQMSGIDLIAVLLVMLFVIVELFIGGWTATKSITAIVQRLDGKKMWLFIAVDCAVFLCNWLVLFVFFERQMLTLPAIMGFLTIFVVLLTILIKLIEAADSRNR